MPYRLLLALFSFIVTSQTSFADEPIFGNKSSYVSGVKITIDKQKEGTVNLLEDIRVKLLRQASRFPKKGKPKVLKVNITSFNLKNPLQAWAIGDADYVRTYVDVIDKRSGKKETTFRASYFKVGLQGSAGAVVTAAKNPIDTERELADGLAKKVFLYLYGEKKAEAAEKRKPAKIRASYPKSYKELNLERKCKQAYEASKIKLEGIDTDEEFKPSKECLKYTPAKRG